MQVFVDAACNPDTTDPEAAMYQVIVKIKNYLFNIFIISASRVLNVYILLCNLQAISELPQPNRDTLAYLMIHLQTIAANYKVNKVRNI